MKFYPFYKKNYHHFRTIYNDTNIQLRETDENAVKKRSEIISTFGQKTFTIELTMVF